MFVVQLQKCQDATGNGSSLGPGMPGMLSQADQGALRTARVSASPGLWHLPGYGDRPRPGQNVDLLMGLAWWVPWPEGQGSG